VFEKNEKILSALHGRKPREGGKKRHPAKVRMQCDEFKKKERKAEYPLSKSGGRGVEGSGFRKPTDAAKTTA